MIVSLAHYYVDVKSLAFACDMHYIG